LSCGIEGDAAQAASRRISSGEQDKGTWHITPFIKGSGDAVENYMRNPPSEM
jgi:hypothetical protein